MGWASGSDIACAMVTAINEYVKDDIIKVKLYEVLIEELEQQDCDTLDEAMKIDPVYDEVILKLNPDWREWYEPTSR